jgi:hypothetical protein
MMIDGRSYRRRSRQLSAAAHGPTTMMMLRYSLVFTSAPTRQAEKSMKNAKKGSHAFV